MPTPNTSPVNITFPNTARFVVEFFDTFGALTVPTSGTLTISYRDRVTMTQTSTDIALEQTNSFFLGIWSSSGAAFGLVNWSVSAPGITVPAAAGQLRILDPDGPG